MTAAAESVPVSTHDPVNAQILAVSEDRIGGFHRQPLHEIARLSEVPLETVVERIRAMLQAGTIRRVRQTLMANDLAPGALVAWRVPQERLDAAFDYLFQKDPFSGHVVVRSTDAETAGSQYKLWTTLKVPQGFSMQKHGEYLARQIGADHFKLMPAKGIFVLGVGHVRRREIPFGSKGEAPAAMHAIEVQALSDLEWQVLVALKREFAVEELVPDLWAARAAEAGISLEKFYEVAEGLVKRGVVGRFSTFLEHVKANAAGERVTRFNALFHWAVPKGRELEAGCQVGRFHILTHAYWREGGPEFNHVNIMAVAHGTDKEKVQGHKAAIDAHLREMGIPVSYTNIFWGGRSEIKPSEIAPQAYKAWAEANGVDWRQMTA
ncbi:MAG: Lrp/AsnC family transcriptional regulator [Verrucomicrobium sp.]|nr:Lrp/AsnC family transcriptional regulator [Verrucomicrobium sp.]